MLVAIAPIKELREMFGVTQRDLAKESEVSTKTLRRAEQGKSVKEPSAEAIMGALNRLTDGKHQLSDLFSDSRGQTPLSGEQLRQIAIPQKLVDDRFSKHSLIENAIRECGAEYLHYVITHSIPKKCHVVLKHGVTASTAKDLELNLRRLAQRSGI
jgi:transcriptional regulator with XRE-family HTH domain